MHLDDILFKLARKYRSLLVKASVVYSRSKVAGYRREVVKNTGKSVVDRKTKKEIKEYARRRFGSTSYWPYLALYTEVRGEFTEGWLPYDYFRYILLPKFNQEHYRYMSDMKSFDYRLFGDFAVRPLFVFILGVFYNDKQEITDKSLVKELLLKYDNKIVIKEECGLEGKQVYITHSTEFNPEQLDYGTNYIIQPYIKQYKVLHDLHPESVNTFRVTTYLKSDGSVDVKFVTLRFGVDGAKVDNNAYGGQSVFFDSSGKPSKFAYSAGIPVGEKHKNTGFVFSDISIPMFSEMLELCKQAHKKYPYVRLVGWDVCIDEAGRPKLIEWNAVNPGHWSLEAMFGPFWPTDDHF